MTRTALFLMAMIDARSVSSKLWRSLREKQGGVDDGFIRWVKHWLAASWKSGESCVEERGNTTDRVCTGGKDSVSPKEGREKAAPDAVSSHA